MKPIVIRKPDSNTIAKELAKRQSFTPKPIILHSDFDKQNAFINDSARYLAVQCSRRSGKTNGLALRFFKAMETHPKSQSLYLSLTQESARGIMWSVLQELNDKHGLGCTFVESKLTMTHPNGSTLKLMGADLKDYIKRLKGRKFPAVGVDEAQDFGAHLSSLINDVLTPSIADYKDGWLALTGTPGPVPQGFFFEITQQKRFGYSFHEWTILENPYMPDAHAFIEDLKLKQEWDDNHPTLLREYRNKWVLDVNSLWVQYHEKQNHFDKLPDIKPNKWNYIMGVDLGFKDADAIAILAWCEQSPICYLVEEFIMKKQGITELVTEIERLNKKYECYKIVMDEGGLGKKIAEEVRRQHSIPVHPADKMLKQQNVEFLNDNLRLGKFKANRNSRFAKDSYIVQIDWDKSSPNKIVVKKQPHSDIIDAVLYAFKEASTFAYRSEPTKPQYGTKEWADAQASEMFDKALEYYESQADILRKIDGQGWE